MAPTEIARHGRKGLTGRTRARSRAQQRAPVPVEKPSTAKLFMHGRSQAVRLPKEFRLPGKEVRVSRHGNGVLLEPMPFDVKAWFARLDALNEKYGPFLAEGIDEPPPVDPEIIFDK